MSTGYTAQLDPQNTVLLAFDPDTNSFRTTGGGGGGGGTPIQTVAMVDDNSAFLRTFVYDSDGAITAQVDTDLDGSPYSPVGGLFPYSKQSYFGEAPFFNDNTDTAITTATYVEVLAATSNVVNRVEIYNSSASTLVFAVGDDGAEVVQFYIMPSGNGPVDFHIVPGSRVAVKALDADATTGILVINFFT